MKSLMKYAIAAAAVALVIATVQPAHAACPVPRLIDANGAFLVSNPNWNAAPGYGQYDYQGGGPISRNFSGIFWAWTPTDSGGDPVYLLGNDNGSWGAFDNWTKSRTYAGPYGLYYYPGFFSINDGAYGYAPGTTPNWASTSEIDGCPTLLTPSVPNDECTCILLTDEWDGQGYFALFGVKSSGNGNFILPFVGGETIPFAPIPSPSINASQRDQTGTTGDVFFMDVSIPGIPAAGDFRDPECDCGVGFRVFSQLTSRAGAPTDRRTCTPNDYENDPMFGSAPVSAICQNLGLDWIPATAPDGSPQPVNPIGGSAMVQVDCASDQELNLFLNTQFVADAAGGMAGGFGSSDSLTVQCGANAVDNPERPDRETPGRNDAPRGRSKTGRGTSGRR